MPKRVETLMEGEIYHIFNRSIKGITLFESDRYYQRMQMTLWFYLFSSQKIRLSNYLAKSREERNRLKLEWGKKEKQVMILAYVLMPNHFHLLIKQLSENGIKIYLNQVQNSLAHYYNKKKNRYGPVFSGRYKAVRIDNQEQLVHVSRYIHLNPVTAFIVDKVDNLAQYNWSSWKEYLSIYQWPEFCDPNEILKYFRGVEDYIQFVKSDVDFQRIFKKELKLWMDMF